MQGWIFTPQPNFGWRSIVVTSTIRPVHPSIQILSGPLLRNYTWQLVHIFRADQHNIVTLHYGVTVTFDSFFTLELLSRQCPLHNCSPMQYVKHPIHVLFLYSQWYAVSMFNTATSITFVLSQQGFSKSISQIRGGVIKRMFASNQGIGCTITCQK